ncbi:MAG: hypothetical protein J0H19_02030 [Rhodospirillales bacterium]|nr:hypothetical protein [Rhodospirillales bacterium]MBN8902673.1 hypothetical protein [Rhodospirillales bacterium]MBN8925381.1 hypothetical protein [Rhodospirillales bacterium]
MTAGLGPHRPYTRSTPTPPVGFIPQSGGVPMFDLLYLLLGAAFLGGCVLYAFGCERL